MRLTLVTREGDITSGKRYLMIHRACGHAFVGTSSRTGRGDSFDRLSPKGWHYLCDKCAMGFSWSNRWRAQMYFEIDNGE